MCDYGVLESLANRKWFKLCNDFITNKVMYFCEQTPDSYSGGIFESYIKGYFGLEVLYRFQIFGSESCYLRAIFKAAYPFTSYLPYGFIPPLGEIIGGNDSDGIQGDSVFVHNRQISKDTKQMTFRTIPNFVRLEAVEYCSDIGGEFFNLFIITKLFRGKKYGEINFEDSICQVIQDGMEIMNGITSDETQSEGDVLIDLNAYTQNMLFPFSIYVRDNIMWSECEEIPGLTLEILDVLQSPIDPLTSDFDDVLCNIVRQDYYPPCKNESNSIALSNDAFPNYLKKYYPTQPNRTSILASL